MTDMSEEASAPSHESTPVQAAKNNEHICYLHGALHYILMELITCFLKMHAAAARSGESILPHRGQVQRTAQAGLPSGRLDTKYSEFTRAPRRCVV